jgi:hypothetical protein
MIPENVAENLKLNLLKQNVDMFDIAKDCIISDNPVEFSQIG